MQGLAFVDDLYKTSIWQVDRFPPLVTDAIIQAGDNCGGLLFLVELFQRATLADIAIADQKFVALTVNILRSKQIGFADVPVHELPHRFFIFDGN